MFDTLRERCLSYYRRAENVSEREELLYFCGRVQHSYNCSVLRRLFTAVRCSLATSETPETRTGC